MNQKKLQANIEKLVAPGNVATMLLLISEHVAEVIGEDETPTVVATRYGTDDDSMIQTIGDGEAEWKAPRNELRAEQRKRAGL